MENREGGHLGQGNSCYTGLGSLLEAGWATRCQGWEIPPKPTERIWANEDAYRDL